MQKGGSLRHRLFLSGVLGGVFIIFAYTAHAAGNARLFLSPASGTHQVGQAFTVVVSVNTGGHDINAAEGRVKFDPAMLSVQRLSSAGTIFSMNVQEPSYSNTEGVVTFSGIIMNPGYKGTAGRLLAITFVPRRAGATAVTFTSGSVLANDGSGTNVLAGTSGSSYTITGAVPQAAETPQASLKDAAAPIVRSATHPDSDKWYTSNDPHFSWEVPDGVTDVSYLINPKPTARPGTVSDGLKSEVVFSDVAEGKNYFHIAFRRNGTWGPVTHFAFNVDSRAPTAVSLRRIDPEDATNPRPIVELSASDDVSGVDRYEIAISGERITISAEDAVKPYAMPFLSPGTHTATVVAFDAAGNTTSGQSSLSVTALEAPTVDGYTATVAAGEAHVMTGHGLPGTTLTLRCVFDATLLDRVFFRNFAVSEMETTVGQDGTWSITHTLSAGSWTHTAVVQDERGAISAPSAAVIVEIAGGLTDRLAEGLTDRLAEGRWYLLLGWLVLLVILLILAYRLCIWAARILAHRWARRGRSRVEATEHEADDKLGDIIADIDDEIGVMKRLSRHRDLYPEEQYLVSKLSQYRKVIGAVRGIRPSGVRRRRKKA